MRSRTNTIRGNRIILQIGISGSPESFTTIASLASTSIHLENKVIEASNLASGKWRKLLAGSGIASLAISGSGTFTNSEAENILEDSAFSGSIENYQLLLENGDTITAPFLISSYKREGEGFSVVLESGGEIV